MLFSYLQKVGKATLIVELEAVFYGYFLDLDHILSASEASAWVFEAVEARARRPGFSGLDYYPLREKLMHQLEHGTSRQKLELI